MPQEFGGAAIDGFFDTPAEGIVLIGRGIAARQAGTNQTVLAVVTVFGDEFLPCATTFAGQVAVGVVVLVAVALHQQAVAFDVGQVCGGLVALAQQVAGRVVGEAFRGAATDVDQAVERVVVVAAIAFATVIDGSEVAIGGVSVATVEQIALLLAGAVRLQSTLFVVLV